MFLRKLEISNFRGISNLSIKLDETTVFIGENNTGKSTILDALKICLNPGLNRKGGAFSEYDYHLPQKDSQPVDSDPIEITMYFVEQTENEWPDTVSQRLADVVQVDDNDQHSVVLRVRSKYDEVMEDFVTSWGFLDLVGNELVRGNRTRDLNSLQQLTPTFYLAALRDSAREFNPRSQFWGPFVRSLKIEPALRAELEYELSILNQKILSAHQPFETIKNQLDKTSKIVPLASDDPIGIEAIPGKLFDILSRAQVMLGASTGVHLPIGRHGEGTQSLAVICLFDAFLQDKLGTSYTEDSTPILALEEPEAHLHPAAIRSIANLLGDLKGQKVIATHSGDLVSGFSLQSLRRLRRKNNEIAVHQIEEDSLTNDEIHKIDYHVRSTRGSLLFSRCWLLVEGETDKLLFEECARVLGHDLVSKGVILVEYTQIGVEVLLRFANLFGIEWILVADCDESGEQYINSAREQLEDRSEECHLHKLEHGDIEVFLCMEGYGAVYEGNISPQKRNTVIAETGSLAYWNQVTEAQSKKSKPKNAAKVIEQINLRSKQGVPIQIRDILMASINLASRT